MKKEYKDFNVISIRKGAHFMCTFNVDYIEVEVTRKIDNRKFYIYVENLFEYTIIVANESVTKYLDANLERDLDKYIIIEENEKELKESEFYEIYEDCNNYLRSLYK